jgi:hypothetical protein
MSGAAEVAQHVESRARMRDYSLQFTSEDLPCSSRPCGSEV